MIPIAALARRYGDGQRVFDNEGNLSVSEQLLTALATTTLLTSIFALKFRYWNRPKILVAYFILFGAIEGLCHHYFVPDGALGYGLAYLLFALTVPVIIAIMIIIRLEQRDGHTQG